MGVRRAGTKVNVAAMGAYMLVCMAMIVIVRVIMGMTVGMVVIVIVIVIVLVIVIVIVIAMMVVPMGVHGAVGMHMAVPVFIAFQAGFTRAASANRAHRFVSCCN